MITLESVGLVFLGALPPLITIWITKHYEDKRHRREVIVRTAVENWKFSSEMVRKTTKAMGGTAELYPLDDFIIHWSTMANVMTGKKITAKKLAKQREKSEELQKILDENRKKKEKNEKKKEAEKN